MTTVEFLDRPPIGWFVLDVIRCQARKRDWFALIVDVHPDEFKHWHTARQAWVRIPGKHRNWDAAWDALEELMATRH